mmetsp:Transcript_15008/g.32341  ORF Transcript_15008/g.32341 Transcript_15008/m.32341 type:complete len:703 (-) Transcript_15008:352-2460(-)
MLAQSFEIKVGLLGYVSVGKTTGLNALFQGKFSEVSMKRTTAGINFFRVSSLTKPPKRTKTAGSGSSKDDSSMDWQNVDNSTAASAEDSSESSYVDAEDTLKETTADNAKLRESNELQERTFDIELDEPLLKDMREDTRLVIADIPGINEAGTSKLYLDYVEKTWDTYDAMVVVMDAGLGVNTDEQVDLLKFVKKNIDEKKQVPVIIVCNKVDDPDDEELMALVKEARNEVEKIFRVDDRTKALEAITTGDMNTYGGKLSPAFLPASFENAFLYRSASRLQLSELKRLDKVYIDKIGHEEVGKYKWKKLSEEKKYELVHQVVSDPAQYNERLEASNFDTLLDILQFFLGGKKTQEGIIEKQLEVALTKLTVSDGITEQLTAVFDRSAALGKDTSHLEAKFWSLYRPFHQSSFQRFYNDPSRVTDMHAPMKELIAFAQGLQKKLSRDSSGVAEGIGKKKIIDAMKDLIRQQINVILEKEAGWVPTELPNNNGASPPSYRAHWTWNGSYWYNSASGRSDYTSKDYHPEDTFPDSWVWHDETCKWKSQYSGKEIEGTHDKNPANKPFPPLSSWEDMSPRDWSTVASSILILSGRKAFYENFGQEIADLEWMARTGNVNQCFNKPEGYCFTCKTTCGYGPQDGGHIIMQPYASWMKGTYVNGVFTPDDKRKYDRVVQIKVPDNISDPSHWGHLSWLFCEFIDSLEA